MILCVGLATVDLVYRVDRMPGVDEKAQARSAEVAAGGPAANAAVTAAALGAPVTLVTAIGAHPLGALIRSDLEASGVRVVDAARHSDALPPISTVVVVDGTGQRTIVSRNAGDLAYGVPEEGLPPAAVTLVDGHHPVLATAAARSATRLVVDAGSWRPVFHDIFPYAEVVACSATFRHPAAENRPATESHRSTIAGIDAATATAIGAPTVVVTHGPDPVAWFSGPRSGTVPVPPVEAVDTAGAGDAFHGALTHALWTNAPLETALREAIRVAGVRVRHSGARNWLSAL
ncbi:carbohydrate kinase [Actinoplanes bogorensis]|uniref:Carbohydrate kinase n=1 Tax=Paractinoplanes bogorensis TaxID=1610840 RepID=A0ABS5Z5N4_9ACTN|nr:PfkB family carbohydrate kinase [Actinoplanes bogorensis]MBU2671000.1 carbohydrate kinase [Actinoplanes bogorensis]